MHWSVHPRMTFRWTAKVVHITHSPSLHLSHCTFSLLSPVPLYQSFTFKRLLSPTRTYNAHTMHTHTHTHTHIHSHAHSLTLFLSDLPPLYQYFFTPNDVSMGGSGALLLSLSLGFCRSLSFISQVKTKNLQNQKYLYYLGLLLSHLLSLRSLTLTHTQTHTHIRTISRATLSISHTLLTAPEVVSGKIPQMQKDAYSSLLWSVGVFCYHIFAEKVGLALF